MGASGNTGDGADKGRDVGRSAGCRGRLGPRRVPASSICTRKSVPGCCGRRAGAHCGIVQYWVAAARTFHVKHPVGPVGRAFPVERARPASIAQRLAWRTGCLGELFWGAPQVRRPLCGVRLRRYGMNGAQRSAPAGLRSASCGTTARIAFMSSRHSVRDGFGAGVALDVRAPGWRLTWPVGASAPRRSFT